MGIPTSIFILVGYSVGYYSTVASALRIQLENLFRPEWSPLYVGDRPRFATATSVRLLDEQTLVCSSLLARKIYLIRFDLACGSYTVLDGVDTIYSGSPTQTDLCDIDALGHGYVITSNCESGGMSIYRVSRDKISHDRDLFTGLSGNYCHGARFCGPDVVAATALRDPRGVHFYDVQTMRKLLYVSTDRLPKDVCFLPDNRAVVITTDGAPLPERSSARNVSELLLIEYDLARGTSVIVNRQMCEARQLDSVVLYEDRLYISDSHGGRILVVDTRTLRQIYQIEGYDFPHGVDVRHGMLAVACYGTNAIHVGSI